MTEVKTIKDIDDDTWARFKSLAAKNHSKLGEFFKIILNEYEKDSGNFWKEILSRKPTSTDEEAEEMHRIVKKLRKEKGYRI